MIDIDELKKVLAEATPGKFPGGEWQAGDDAIYLGVGLMLMDDFWEEDARAIVALHNAAPGMIEELEAARAVCELITLWAGVEMTTLHPDIAKALRKWQKARGEG